MASGLSNAAMVIAADALSPVIAKARLHNDDPGDGTANLTTADSQSVTFGSATGFGDFSLTTPAVFTGLAAYAAATWVSLWDTAEDTWCGNAQLGGDQAANAAGQYTLADLTFTGTT